MTYSIVAEGLVKRFGTTRALDGIDLEVPTGTVFGLRGSVSPLRAQYATASA